MPSYSVDDGSPRRALAIGVALVLACVALFFVTRQQEDRTRGVLADDLTLKARKAVVLLDEAHLVCLDTAASILEHRRKLSKRKDDKGRIVSQRTWEHAMPDGAGADLAFGRELIREAVAMTGSARRTSMRMAPRLGNAPVFAGLKALASAARTLCQQAGQGYSGLDEYEFGITSKLRTYKVEVARLGPEYVVPEVERVALLNELEPSLTESRRVASRVSRPLLDDAADWVPREAPAITPKTPRQLKAERRDLQVEEEWRQRQAEQRENLHREAIGRWRDEPQPTRQAMPRLGLQEVDKESLTGQVSRVRSWSEVHRRETGPVTVALRRFDMIRRIEPDERTRRACRALFSKVTDLLQSKELFASPMADLNSLLEQGYSAAAQAAESCLAGDMAAANSHFDRAEEAFAKIQTDFGLASN